MNGARNVLGTPLQPCSFDPLTGWQRDGCCHTDDHDAGSHAVCARMTPACLNHQMERGNDLITPRPEHRFPGLKPGDKWCVCALSWREAYEAGYAPPVLIAQFDVNGGAPAPTAAVPAAAAPARRRCSRR